MPHVVNKAVEEQFKRKSAVVKEMLAPESKGRDRCGGTAEAANKTTGACACTRNGRRYSEKSMSKYRSFKVQILKYAKTRVGITELAKCFARK